MLPNSQCAHDPPPVDLAAEKRFLKEAEVDLELLDLAEMVDGRLVRAELFAIEQLEQATARFHEIESSSPN